MSGGAWLAGAPSWAILALLFAGHAVGDFVLQTERMVAGKDRPGPLFLHLGVATAAHTVLLLPFLSWWMALLVLTVGVGHAAIDAVKTRLAARRMAELPLFVLDQVAHVAVLVVAWLAWGSSVQANAAVWARPFGEAFLIRAGVLVAAYAFNWNGAAGLVKGLLARYELGAVAGEPAGGAGFRGSGRVIGILERMIALTLVLEGEWGALGLVFAGKSIARFKALEDRRFGEYYLIGTLASVALAIATGVLVRGLLGLVR